MSGFNESNSGWTGISPNPQGVPNPTRKATANSTSPFRYSRRYLDWNRATFEFHTAGMQVDKSGLSTTADITKYRDELQLSRVFGCTPRNFCITCAPFNSSDSIFPLLSQALAETVVNETRKDIPRYVIANTGGVRVDMYKGPFTYDDFFTIMPSRNSLLYIPEIGCSKAATLLDELNRVTTRQHNPISFEFDLCVDPIVTPLMARDGSSHTYAFNAVTKRQVVDLVPGHTTVDEFGSDGDDIVHSPIPYHDLPQYYQGAAGFGVEGCTGVADVVFVDL